MAMSYGEQIAALTERAETAESTNAAAIAHLNTRLREHDAELRAATARVRSQYEEDARALRWLLSQVQRDPRPLRCDADCWLRHINCFAIRLLRDGGAGAVARDLQWKRAREATGVTP